MRGHTTESYWSLPETGDIHSPDRILRDQADALRAETHGALVGVVETINRGPGALTHELWIRVPALNNYSFHLLSYTHSGKMYPGNVESMIDDLSLGRVENEEQFDKYMRALLSSPECQDIVGALLTQARDAAPTKKHGERRRPAREHAK
jgi:hypothetical protein